MFGSTRDAGKLDVVKRAQVERQRRQLARDEALLANEKLAATLIFQSYFRRKKKVRKIYRSVELLLAQELKSTVSLDARAFTRVARTVLSLYGAASQLALSRGLKPPEFAAESVVIHWKRTRGCTEGNKRGLSFSHGVLNSLMEKEINFQGCVGGDKLKSALPLLQHKLVLLQFGFLYTAVAEAIGERNFFTSKEVRSALQCLINCDYAFFNTEANSATIWERLLKPALCMQTRDLSLKLESDCLDYWKRCAQKYLKLPLLNLRLLSVPLLCYYTHELKEWRAEVILNYPFKTWASSNYLKAEILDAESAAYLLGNLAQLLEPVLKANPCSGPDTGMVDFITEVVLRGLDFIGDREELPSNVTHHPLFKWLAGSHSLLTSPKVQLKLVLKQLEVLWTENVLKGMVPSHELADLWATGKVQSTPSKPDSLGDRVVQVHVFCRLYLSLVYLFEELKSNLLVKLCSVRYIVPLLWRVIMTVSPGGTWDPQSKGSMRALLSAAQQSKCEGLFCYATFTLGLLLFPSYFCVVTQEEANGETMELTLFSSSELREISLFLNDFCFTNIYLSERALTLRTSSALPTLKSFSREVGLAVAMLRALKQRNDRAALPWVESNKLWLQKASCKKQFWVQYREKQPGSLLVMHCMPWCTTFESRISLLRELVELEKSKHSSTSYTIVVQRGRCFEDVFAQLSKLSGTQLKHQLKVKYVNALGVQEQGLDLFGLFKEMVADALREAFLPEFGLFKWTPAGDGAVYFSSTSRVHGKETALVMYEVIGKLVGKALYEGLVIDYPFPLFFYGKLINRYAFLDELPSYDPALYKQLMKLKQESGECESWGLYFAVNEDHVGTLVEVELKPGGSQTLVNGNNKYEYIYLLADYYLNGYCNEQVQAYLAGFQSVFTPSLLRMFSASELSRIMTGERGPLDVKNLQENTRYVNGYNALHPTVRSLWKVVSQMSAEDQRLFLQYVTSCTRAPVGGFKYLSPPFTIALIELPSNDDNNHTGEFVVPELPRNSSRNVGLVSRFLTWTGLKADAAVAQGRLPTASTCFNLLKLPAYKSLKVLEERLLYAIRSQSGFEQL